MKKSLITIFAVTVTVIAMAAGTKVWVYSHSGNHRSIDIADFDSLSFVEPGLLEISPIEKKIGNEGGRFTLEITANKPWTASSNDPAVILGTTQGTGNAKIACTAMPNTEEEPYTAIITVRLEDGTYKQTFVTVGLIDIAIKNLTVYINESAQLQYTTVPAGVSINQFSLSSSNTSVATVDPDGTVHGIKEGTAKITAKCGDLSSSCTVTVKKVAVTSVTLSQTEARLYYKEGETLQLTATVEPVNASYPTVTWKSSNTSVATVSDDGLVTCKGYGKATIIATADGKSAFCTVQFEAIHVKSVTIAQDKYFIEKDQSVQITATVEPVNASYPTVTWKSSNQSVATVSSTGVVTGKGAGKATITATAEGKTGACYVAVIEIETGTVTDCQNNTYKTVKICDQWWMAENLRCTKYDTESPKYGGTIYSPTPNQYEPYVVTPDLSDATNMTSAQKDKAGLYYNWAAAVGTDDATSYAGGQGICPNGWRMPSISDWATLRSTIQSLTGQERIGVYLVSSSGWNEDNKYGGYDLFGFNALPVGYYNNYQSGQTLSAGSACLFWSSGKYNQASYLGYDAYYTDIWGGSDGGTIQENNHKACYHGLPVRCIKN